MSQGANQVQVIIGSDNGLSHLWQAIIWTNDDSAHLDIYSIWKWTSMS